MDHQDQERAFDIEEGHAATRGLTPMQAKFAHLVGRDGMNLTKAAEAAGFAERAQLRFAPDA
jgi:hypothetical protein